MEVVVRHAHDPELVEGERGTRFMRPNRSYKQMKKFTITMLFSAAIVVIALWTPLPTLAFTGEGCAEGACSDCHSLNKQEASQLLKGMVQSVKSVEFSEVPGLWVAHVVDREREGLVYIDFSKKYVISGQVLHIANRENVTKAKMREFVRVDPTVIPLSDTLLIGRKDAGKKVIVFTDPQCPYCKTLHTELKKVVQKDKNIAFLIKLFPLISIHPDSARISRSIVCSKSIKMLEDSFADRPIPDPACETDIVEKNRALAKALGIRSTPTMVLPDGRVAAGAMKADEIIKLIYENK